MIGACLFGLLCAVLILLAGLNRDADNAARERHNVGRRALRTYLEGKNK